MKLSGPDPIASSIWATVVLLIGIFLVVPWEVKSEQVAVTSPTGSTPTPACADQNGVVTFCPFQRAADSGVRRLRASANIIYPSYTLLSNGQGRFRGFVSGQGTVHLNLVFFEGERVVARKYMGYVQLKKGEKRVPFRFETTLPEGRSLKWRILATELS